MKNKVYLCAIILAVTFVFSACTADNSEKPMICRRVGFDFENGEVIITAAYMSVGKDSTSDEDETVKTYRAESAEEAAEFLLDKESDAMFKPVKSLVFGKTLEDEEKISVMAHFLSRNEFQLKCMVYDVGNAAEKVSDANALKDEKGTTFAEYFRKITNKKEKITF